MKKILFSLAFYFIAAFIFQEYAIAASKDIPVYSYQILKIYPHSTAAFTEGLVMDDGFLYESTGLWGQSKLFQTELSTGKIINEHSLPVQYFGEGITILNGKVYQLTYLSNTGFIYDKTNLKLEKTFHYPFQGWGLTTDGKSLIMSNGSASLVFLNPNTFQVEKYLIVTEGKNSIGSLNELEYITGYIYANIYQTNFIAIISPENGKIAGWIDLTGLNPLPKAFQYSDVLNGIAYLKQNQALLITGKNWPNLYEIHFNKLRARNLPLVS